jgi:hypothetical protein
VSQDLLEALYGGLHKRESVGAWTVDRPLSSFTEQMVA